MPSSVACTSSFGPGADGVSGPRRRFTSASRAAARSRAVSVGASNAPAVGAVSDLADAGAGTDGGFDSSIAGPGFGASYFAVGCC